MDDGVQTCRCAPSLSSLRLSISCVLRRYHAPLCCAPSRRGSFRPHRLPSCP